MENIRHLGLVVSNMEKALKFYQDLLGLHVQGKTDENGEFISTVLSSQNIKVKTVKLSADDNSTRLELLQFENPKINQTKKISLFEPGFTHIALTVKNLDEIYLRLKNSKTEFNSIPTISSNGTLKVVFCKDFEGNYLELIEEI
ncbi:MAG: VOC family protein [Nitrosopumilus sp.]|nr:VOC family protein [Nitrosopumilus sp.]